MEKLSVPDRVMLLDVLPQFGDITTLRIVRELRENLSFTEEEHKTLGIKVKDGRVEWKHNKDVEIEMGHKALEVIAQALKTLNDQKRLSLQHMELYDRFVEK